MANNQDIINDETKKYIQYTKELVNLEMNFRKYIFENGLSEQNYELASSEYSQKIKEIRLEVSRIEDTINQIDNNNYVEKDTLEELNIELGRIWRIIVANKTFVNDYGSVNFDEGKHSNLYKQIYDKHLEELNEFMDYFIGLANILFSK